MKAYPRGFLTVLLASLLLMAVSGLLLTPTSLTMRFDMELPWRLTHGGRLMTAATHAFAGFILMLLTGALWSVHMRSGWRRGRQRVSGVSLGLSLLTLAATAIALYYLGDDSLAAGAAFLHLAAGLMLSGLFVWHWAYGRRALVRHGAGTDGRTGPALAPQCQDAGRPC